MITGFYPDRSRSVRTGNDRTEKPVAILGAFGVVKFATRFLGFVSALVWLRNVNRV